MESYGLALNVNFLTPFSLSYHMLKSGNRREKKKEKKLRKYQHEGNCILDIAKARLWFVPSQQRYKRKFYFHQTIFKKQTKK